MPYKKIDKRNQPKIDKLLDSWKESYYAYDDSKLEGEKVKDYLFGRQYTQAQLNKIKELRIPKQMYNVVLKYHNNLIGYLSTIINTVNIEPRTQEDIVNAQLRQDVVQYIFDTNYFEDTLNRLKSSMILTGLAICEVGVEGQKHKNGKDKTDKYGRQLYDIKLSYVPADEVYLDPFSKAPDYSDARYIHRAKWFTRESVIELFGESALSELEAAPNHNPTEDANLDFSNNFTNLSAEHFRMWDNYLIINTVAKDGKEWKSYYWTQGYLIKEEKITFRDLHFPYIVVRLFDSDKAEHRGIFSSLIGAQDSINQALSFIQKQIAAKKVFLEDGAVDDVSTFAKEFSSLDAIVNLNAGGIGKFKVEDFNLDIQQQFQIIKENIDIVQSVIGINDSFLGMANASDSGKKVALQQNAGLVSLRYLTGKIELLMKLIAESIISLAGQYMTAEQELRVADNWTKNKFFTINQSMMLDRPAIDENGNITMAKEPVMDYKTHPETGEIEKDENGNIIVVPFVDPKTSLDYGSTMVRITTAPYNNETEREKEQIAQVVGTVGQVLLGAGKVPEVLKMYEKMVQNMQFKDSEEIAQMIGQAAQDISQQQVQAQQMQQMQMQQMQQPQLEQPPQNIFGNNNQNQKVM